MPLGPDRRTGEFQPYSHGQRLTRFRRGSLLLVVFALGLAGYFAAGCRPQHTLTPKEVLDRMVAAYHDASSYADAGTLHVEADAGGQKTENDFDFSVTFQRPDKLRMHLYQSQVVSDGVRFRATIKELAGQVLDLPAPKKLTLENIHEDYLLSKVTTEQMGGGSVQLMLLLDDNPLEKITGGSAKVELLQPKTVEDHKCYRVKIKNDAGELVFWIDQETFVLRRADYPTEALRKSLEKDGPVGDVAMTVDFKGATIGGKIDPAAFKFELPGKSTKLVPYFKAMMPPSKMLGQPIESFTLRKLDGGEETRESLAGKIVVLDFWSTTCGWCFEGFPKLERVYKKYKDNPKVVILAVSTDPDNIGDETLSKMFADAKVGLPIARISEKDATGAFAIKEWPTCFILGADGVVQKHELGYNPHVERELPGQLDALLAGKSIFEDSVREYQELMAAYAEAGGTQEADSNAQQVDVTPAEIAPASEPDAFKLTKLWSSTDLKKPGNMVVDSTVEGGRIWVLDGWNAVGEFDGKGKLLARHELELPENTALSFLRTAVDKSGKRFFVASASMQQQLFLFDDAWKQVLAFPSEGKHDGISDVQLADLDGDGQLELNVGYWGVVGVQNVDFTGKRRWTNRMVDNVLKVAVSEPDKQGKRELICTDGHGALIAIDSTGKNREPFGVEGLFLRYVTAADLDGDGEAELACLGGTKAGADALVGTSVAGGTSWRYDLPQGVQNIGSIEPICAGNLTGAPASQWIVSAPDGSIHVLAKDGTVIEHFNYGAAAAGLGYIKVDGAPVLLVATAKSVDAWRADPATRRK